MIFLKVSLLNLLRHKKRTAVIAAAIAVSVMSMLFVGAMLDGMAASFYENLFESTAHLTIEESGRGDALNPYSLDYTIQKVSPLKQELSRRLPNADIESVYDFGALLLDSDTPPESIEMAGYGIESDTRFFGNVKDSVESSSFPPAPGTIMISKETGVLLEVSSGDKVMLLTEDSSGSPFYMEFTVGPLFETNLSDFDSTRLFISREDAQELLYYDDGATMIWVNGSDPEQAASMKQDLATFLETENLTGETWKEAEGSFISLVELFDVFMVFINIFIIVVAATVITNAILMNVFEKTKEYGTLRAIGMKRRQTFGLILLEGTVQGVLGTIAGLLVGIPLVLYFVQNGWNWGAITQDFGMGNVIEFRLTMKTILICIISGTAIAIVGSLYAGSVSTRKKLIETLRS